jgi:hypothetical protein
MTTNIGRGITFLGSLLLLISLFITAEKESGFGGESYWHLFPHTSDALLAFAIIGMGLAVLSLFLRPALLLMVASALGLFALGVAYLVPSETAFSGWDELRAGAWLAIVGSLGMIAGGILGAASLGALSALLAPAPPFARRPRTAATPAAAPVSAGQNVVAPPPGGAPEPAPAAPPPAEQQPPPAPAPEPQAQQREAGWYPDPTQQARLRYWTGDAWSEHTAQ